MCGWQAARNYSLDFYCFNNELMNAAHLCLQNNRALDSGHFT
jgi:hypothetical protein